MHLSFWPAPGWNLFSGTNSRLATHNGDNREVCPIKLSAPESRSTIKNAAVVLICRVGRATMIGGFVVLANTRLEFLFWPKQTVLRRERRKSRLCHVLESRNPAPSDGHYHRVISWVDVETDGIVLADAFQKGTRPVKRFSVKGLSKIDGRWQVDELEMRNLKTGSRSRLRFHLEKPAHP